jgi:hypothetical protein
MIGVDIRREAFMTFTIENELKIEGERALKKLLSASFRKLSRPTTLRLHSDMATGDYVNKL